MFSNITYLLLLAATTDAMLPRKTSTLTAEEARRDIVSYYPETPGDCYSQTRGDQRCPKNHRLQEVTNPYLKTHAARAKKGEQHGSFKGQGFTCSTCDKPFRDTHSEQSCYHCKKCKWECCQECFKQQDTIDFWEENKPNLNEYEAATTKCFTCKTSLCDVKPVYIKQRSGRMFRTKSKTVQDEDREFAVSEETAKGMRERHANWDCTSCGTKLCDAKNKEGKEMYGCRRCMDYTCDACNDGATKGKFWLRRGRLETEKRKKLGSNRRRSNSTAQTPSDPTPAQTPSAQTPRESSGTNAQPNDVDSDDTTDEEETDEEKDAKLTRQTAEAEEERALQTFTEEQKRLALAAQHATQQKVERIQQLRETFAKQQTINDRLRRQAALEEGFREYVAHRAGETLTRDAWTVHEDLNELGAEWNGVSWTRQFSDKIVPSQIRSRVLRQAPEFSRVHRAAPKFSAKLEEGFQDYLAQRAVETLTRDTWAAREDLQELKFTVEQTGRPARRRADPAARQRQVLQLALAAAKALHADGETKADSSAARAKDADIKTIAHNARTVKAMSACASLQKSIDRAESVALTEKQRIEQLMKDGVAESEAVAKAKAEAQEAVAKAAETVKKEREKAEKATEKAIKAYKKQIKKDEKRDLKMEEKLAIKQAARSHQEHERLVGQLEQVLELAMKGDIEGKKTEKVLEQQMAYSDAANSQQVDRDAVKKLFSSDGATLPTMPNTGGDPPDVDAHFLSDSLKSTETDVTLLMKGVLKLATTTTMGVLTTGASVALDAIGVAFDVAELAAEVFTEVHNPEQIQQDAMELWTEANDSRKELTSAEKYIKEFFDFKNVRENSQPPPVFLFYEADSGVADEAGNPCEFGLLYRHTTSRVSHLLKGAGTKRYTVATEMTSLRLVPKTQDTADWLKDKVSSDWKETKSGSRVLAPDFEKQQNESGLFSTLIEAQVFSEAQAESFERKEPNQPKPCTSRSEATTTRKVAQQAVKTPRAAPQNFI